MKSSRMKLYKQEQSSSINNAPDQNLMDWTSFSNTKALQKKMHQRIDYLRCVKVMNR